MELMTHQDPDVRYHALSATQKYFAMVASSSQQQLSRVDPFLCYTLNYELNDLYIWNMITVLRFDVDKVVLYGKQVILLASR